MKIKSLLTGVKFSSKKAASTALSLMLGLASLATPAFSSPLKELKPSPKVANTQAVTPHYDYQPDILIVMPDAKAEKDDINEVLTECHGTVVGTLGEGAMRCMIIKTEKGKLEATEKKLGKDRKHFAAVGRNYRIQSNLVPTDRDFANQWHLQFIGAPKAWDKTLGNVKIAIFDTGCQGNIPDLAGKVEKGFDATTVGAHMFGQSGAAFGYVPGLTDAAAELALTGGDPANKDGHGHGTWVATTAAAAINNSVGDPLKANGVGVAPGATIFPVKIGMGGRGTTAITDDLSLIAAMMVALNRGANVINISYNAPVVGFHNPALHAPLHMFFALFHGTRNGLIFMSAGNEGVFDATPSVPYLDVVSGIDRSGRLSDFSNWGPAIKFTAPARGIWVSDIDGSAREVQGTSFSSPILAAEAALIWAKHPGMPNFVVEQILKDSCVRVPGSAFDFHYGYGMPDAERIVNAM